MTPRFMMMKSIYEVDRVLRQGGFLVITDFDTPVKYVRDNKHNEHLPVYKDNYAHVFESLGYTLVEKHSYSHNGDCFAVDVQERVSTQILYKEKIKDIYVYG
jgi:ubiquinone/menaquinone biosynthesis C-methylase UbiE